MKLKYQKEKGSRIKNVMFFGMTHTGFGLWYEEETRTWKEDANPPCSTHAPCKSVRAFKRMLRTAPKGKKFVLSSRYVGYDVYGVGKGE